MPIAVSPTLTRCGEMLRSTRTETRAITCATATSTSNPAAPATPISSG